MKPSGKKGTGDIQPPKNKIDARKDIKIIFAYSAEKNSKSRSRIFNMKSSNNLDSPSATSKGALLVSAIPAIKYTTNIGNKGIKFHPKIHNY